MKILNKGNKVVQYKLLLNEIKTKLHLSDKKTYGGMYYNNRIEITEFCEEKFIINESNYKTYSYYFTKVTEELIEDLQQAWEEVFGKDIPFQILI